MDFRPRTADASHAGFSGEVKFENLSKDVIVTSILKRLSYKKETR